MLRLRLKGSSQQMAWQLYLPTAVRLRWSLQSLWSRISTSGTPIALWAKFNMAEVVAAGQASPVIEGPRPLQPRRTRPGSLSAAVAQQLSLFLDG